MEVKGEGELDFSSRFVEASKFVWPSVLAFEEYGAQHL